MMNPLSKKERRRYLIFFIIVFLVGAPLFIFDAKGYRFDWTGVLGVFKTGGINIRTDQSGIAISVNNVFMKTTSMVQKNFFDQGLKPGSYEIVVSKEGFQSWRKTLKVFPEIVTEAQTFLIKSNPELIEIPRYQSAVGGASTSTGKAAIKNPDYEAINALFIAPPAKSILTKFGTTTPDSKVLGDLFVKNEEGKLHVRWMGALDAIPDYFCENVTCKSEIIIKASSPVLSFDFFPGRNDLLVLRLKDGIVVSEIDDRSAQNIETIVSGLGFDFRIKDGKSVYLKKDSSIYSVSL